MVHQLEQLRLDQEQVGDPLRLDLRQRVGGVYEDIALDTPICGQFWAAGSTRDTDWYRFNLAEASNVTMTVNANIDVTRLVLQIRLLAGSYNSS